MNSNFDGGNGLWKCTGKRKCCCHVISNHSPSDMMLTQEGRTSFQKVELQPEVQEVVKNNDNPFPFKNNDNPFPFKHIKILSHC